MNKLKRTVKVFYLRLIRSLSSDRKVTKPKNTTNISNDMSG